MQCRGSLLSVLGFALLIGYAGTAAAFDGACYYKLVDQTQVITYGYFVDKDGKKTTVPTGSVTYYYYEMTCSSGGDPYYSGGGSGGYMPLKPKVTLLSVDTTDPLRPMICVDVASDPARPAVKVELYMGSNLNKTVSISGDGNHALVFPSVLNYPDGTTAITVRACNATGTYCGQTSTSFTRTTAGPLMNTTTLFARWVEGDEFKSAQYGHIYRQWYTTTTFPSAVEEAGENSRKQLRNAWVTLSWPTPDSGGTPATWNASITSWGVAANTDALPTATCSSPVICSQPCVTKCRDIRTYGILMAARDSVHSMMKASMTAEPMVVMSGGQLYFDIP